MPDKTQSDLQWFPDRSMRLIVVSLALLGLAVSSQLSAQTNKAEPAYLNPALPVDQRVDDLVGRMTLEEKASQVLHKAAAIPRLNVPAYDWWTEALHGVADGTATVFPEPIGLASTFDAPLIHTLGEAISIEARAKHNEDIRKGKFWGVGLDFWAPNINIFRDPRWGRGQETYGEDPFLTGQMAISYVTGMQGDDPKYLRVIATPKHYAVHSGPEPLRHKVDVSVSKHDEEDTYLWAFRAAIVEGKADSIMCAYNSVNGEPACANKFLLEDQLRNRWGFQGYVVSDCDAVWDISRGHHYVGTREEAVAISMKRGTDLDCNEPAGGFHPYVNAVKQGLLPEKDLDTAVKRLMRARMRLGMFDPPEMVKYAQIPISENDSTEHRALALKAARESIVLLKNDGTLPLKDTVKRITVVGPLADQLEVLYGNYNGTPSHATSALDGIRQQFVNAQVTFSPGTDFLHGKGKPSSLPAPGTKAFQADAVLLNQAVTSAKQADVVIAVVGINSELEGEQRKVNIPGFEGGDRTSLDLPDPEEKLLQAVQATGKPLVVVLMNGSALSVNWASEHANAILDAWYSGEEGGKAIAQTLSGDNNPAGRLPVTFYKSVDQLPPFTDYAMTNRTYRYFQGQPLYPFGYGLSYSQFAYSNPKLSSNAIQAGDDLLVDVDVRNTDGPGGDEVAELYLIFPQIPGAPIRALRGFKRVHLDAGTSQHLQFTLTPRDLNAVSPDGDRLVAPGKYKLSVGSGQPGTATAIVETEFEIQGERHLPE